MERYPVRRTSIGLAAAALLALAGSAFAQAPGTPADTTAAPAVTPVTPPPATPPPTPAPAPAKAEGEKKPIYFGGAVGFSFWSDYWRISLEPYAARKMKNPKLSVGARLRYEYLSDSRGVVDHTENNFGGGIFSNYRVNQRFYGHAEYDYMSYDYPGGREAVPFLWVGGGVSQMIRPGVWSIFEVSWDLINDKNSPYESGQPQISIGVAAGF
jgi:hypothetical protein